MGASGLGFDFPLPHCTALYGSYGPKKISLVTLSLSLSLSHTHTR